MRRDLQIKTGNLAGTSDFRVLAPIKKGLVPSLDAVTYKTRVKRVLRTLQAGRVGGFEYELARILSDAVQRVGCIHSVGIAVLESKDGALEPEDKVLLTVTFDGAWESYIRIIWQKVTRLLDLVFCNTEGYVLGYENSYEKWGIWLKQAQSDAYFLSAQPSLTVDDIRYLQMEERVYRREAGDSAEPRVTGIRIPTTEEIAERSIFAFNGMAGIDPTNAGFGKPLRVEEAGRPPFRQGVRALVGLYRLVDLYPPNTPDGVILHRAAHELLPEFDRMLAYSSTYQLGIKRAVKRFPEAMRWLARAPDVPDVRKSLPLPLPDEPPLQNADNVQGGILQGYPDSDYGCLLLVQFASPTGLAKFLEKLHVTSEADQVKPGGIAINIAFTVEGLRAAGLSDDEVRELPEEFVQGMERRAGVLGDLRTNHPRRWRLPALNWDDGVTARDLSENDRAPRIDLSAVHAVLQVRLRATSTVSAMAPRAKLMEAMEDLVGDQANVKPLSLQWMQRQRNKKGEFQEHFGFVDSNSDPVLKKSKAGDRFSNQIHLGELLCGYPNLADKVSPLTEGPDRVRALLKDGSFLVIRKLRQDVAALDKCLGDAVTDTTAAGHPQTRDQLKAKMMGRWPGGTPKAGQPLADAVDPQSNNFHFNNDRSGAECPLHAHIRRANPRTTMPAKGSRPPRIVRRGMSYGPAVDAADPASLDQERGLIFMAYNSSLGEQFELLQRWLSGGNSSGSYSGSSDPLTGLAEAGRRRYFRYDDQGKTVRVALDGSDKLHDEPRPFVRLEWGAYLFAPSKTALSMLQERAAETPGRRSTVSWSAAQGEAEINRLQSIEKRLGAQEAITAWKTALEDPDVATDFTTASIWAAIRERHGGVLKTPFGVLVAERKLYDDALLNTSGSLSVNGYLPRMHESFGEIYLGLDAHDPAYSRDSAACNGAIMALDKEAAFRKARESTAIALQALVDEAKDYARDDGEPTWDLTLDVRELVDPLLADFCESWFGLSQDGNFFFRSGFRWDWKPGEPPNYPGHFIAPSRYFFQPRPGQEVKEIGEEHGVFLRGAMKDFLRAHPHIDAPIARAILESEPGRDLDFAARTLIGAVIGFVPTVNGNVLRILNEWLREGNLWKLRARLGGSEASGFVNACSRLGADFIPAMQLRTAPDVLWRTAAVAHTIGEGPDRVNVARGEIVVLSAISATQQSLQEGTSGLYQSFGGNRRAASHPTHACPGADPALAVMLGFFSALVESPLPLRAGPGPLTLSLDGRFEPRGDRPATTARTRADVMYRAQRLARFRDAQAFQLRGERNRSLAAPLMTIGDSWLCDIERWSDLASSLRKLGYSFVGGDYAASPGMRLAQMADEDYLAQVKAFLLSPGANPPRALLLGGGGNDVVTPDLLANPPKPAPLYRLLTQSTDPDAVVETEVHKFIDMELRGYYEKIIDAVRSVTSIPILIHGYDHPIPDGRPLLDFGGHVFAGPWIQPILAQRGYNIPAFPTGSADLTRAREVMRRLINRLNDMIARLADDHRKIYHVNLTGKLAERFGDPANYATLWDNELHANDEGFDVLAAVIAAKLRELVITA
ncbi:Dyp-type peroxidase [Bradyrhizobium sp. CCGB12]|uniref:Dyp-type peroxidase domain-containing protein n=1 Tax=Bradyrhizobium sp. CCGB12 TaxID=2949632 RepID=UPI0020B288C6|nr:Dyp-type peroxidase domain-containing protein [Bradyrhizobium sp. CCGB12]MCP3391338.1 Dyp-type peroxidase [Bradyrhizobium sp. CCGB12]